MKVAELSEFHRFRLTEAPLTEPGPGEVQVRVRSVGICGSDVHNFAEGGIGDAPAKYPMVLGHEPTGEVVRVGTGVTGLSIGDKAVLEPAIYCYHCEQCMNGHHNTCESIQFLSTAPYPGFFREFVNLPLANVLPVPNGLSMDEATLFEPFAVVLHSLNLGQIRLGETVAVIGAGPIGLLTVLALKLSGAHRIWCVEPLAHRRALAKQLGADVVLDPNQGDVVRQILADTGKRGVDLTFDCATKKNTTAQCIDVTRSAGRVVVTGIPSEVNIPLNFHTLRRKEVVVYNVRRSNHETEAALEMMQAYPKKFAALVTHTLPIDKVQSAFEMLENYEEGVGKLVLTF